MHNKFRHDVKPLVNAHEQAPRHWPAPNQLVLALIGITNNIPRVKTRGYYNGIPTGFLDMVLTASCKNLATQ